MTAARYALICDCDGVLIDSEAVAARILVRELEARWPGTAVGPVLAPLLGLRIERVLEDAAAQLGRSLTADDIGAIREAVEAAAMQAPAVHGVAAALARITLIRACASNSMSRYVTSVLTRTGLIDYFGDRMFCADQVARPKPAPDVYLAAAQAIGIAPADCIVVEDSVTGVTAACAAGMNVLGFIGAGHASAAQGEALRGVGAQQVFDDMQHLPQRVAQSMQRIASARRSI